MILTIVVDDDILERARIRAIEENTSVNAVVRAYLLTYAAEDLQREDACERLLALSRSSRSRRADAVWSRDDLYERRAALPGHERPGLPVRRGHL